MSSLPDFAIYALQFSSYKYFLIFIGTIIEGPILMIACGFLLKLGLFSFIPLYLSVIAGDLVGDIIWYGIGRYFLDTFLVRFGGYLGVDEEILGKVKVLFKRFHTKILFISKITIGFGASLAVLLVAGASRISFKKYTVINLFGEIILVAMLFLIGYILGSAYTKVSDNFKYYFIIAIVLIIPLSLYFLHRYFKTKILEKGSHL
ncbi:MAG: DedA family protein [Candidatus Gracilibacteria bacterium]|nr:DedA family protein [Candidatus Gracilibacteria bacterium]